MKAAVYRLRDRGILLPRPAEPVLGNLLFGWVDRGDLRIHKAQLQLDGRDVMPPLVEAAVTRISRHGLVIKGLELTSRVPRSSKARVTQHPQTWWVLVHTEDYLDFHDGLDPLDADEQAFAGVMATSHNPAA